MSHELRDALVRQFDIAWAGSRRLQQQASSRLAVGVTAWLAAAALLFACATANVETPPRSNVPQTAPSAEQSSGQAAHPAVHLSLPTARNAQPLEELPSPFLTVRGTQITWDGRPAGELPQPGKVSRIDPLFGELNAMRNAAVAQDRKGFPGVAWLAFDARTPINDVKSVAYTAGYAGFPNLKFAVSKPGGEVGILNVDALIVVPSGLGAYDLPSVIMTVKVEKNRWRMVWRKGNATVADSEYSSLLEFERAVNRSWLELGEHRSPSDPKRDQAVIYTSPDLNYADLVQVVDALQATTRQRPVASSTQRLPAFNVTFSGGNVVPGHGNPLLARPTRERIQSAFRERNTEIGACYDQALLRNRDITGKITVRAAIASSGELETIRVDSSSTINDPGMISCVLSEVGRVTFLPFVGESIPIAHPYAFTPREAEGE